MGRGFRVESTKWRFRIPRRYVWEAIKWINEKEKSADGKKRSGGRRRERGEKR